MMDSTWMLVMYKYLRLLLVLISIALLTACSHTSNYTKPDTQATKSKNSRKSYQTSKNDYTNHRGKKIAGLAKTLIGKPYRYGGASPRGFDCSGLVYYTHGKFGITTPRTSLQQHKKAKPIPLTQLQSGDLIFFKLNKNKISHVGIYIGQNQFIHAPVSGKKVSASSLNDPYWRRRIAGSGRFYE